MKIKAKEWKAQDILKSLKEGIIVLPKFQRDISWPQDKINKLKESIKNNCPIGTIILYKKIDTNEKLLLDGQQRCNSLKKIAENNYSEIENYLIPIVEYEEEENKIDNIVEWFVNLNEQGTALDKEDIHLAILSNKKMKRPLWLNTSHDIDIDEMYKIKHMDLEIHYDAKDRKKHLILITELLYLIAKKLGDLNGFSKNRDYYIMARHIDDEKPIQKIKRKLIWIKRILICLFATERDDALIEKSESNFNKKIEKWLSDIFETKTKFNSFCEKLSFVFEEFHKKFWFWNIPFTKAGAEKKKHFTKINLHSYMTIYLFDFLIKNQNLIKKIKKNQKNFQELKNNFANYKINFLDLTWFITKHPISAGGIEGWFNNLLFVENKHILFFPYDDSKKENQKKLELLVEIIFNKSKSESKSPKSISKLCLLWFFENKIRRDYKEYHLGNNPKKTKKQHKYFEFDHTIPLDFVGKQNDCSSLENISILTREKNKQKGSSLEDVYMRNDWVNIVINKNQRAKSKKYKEIIEIIKEWKKRNKVKENEFKKFLKFRKKNFSKAILKKLIKDFLIT